MGTEARELTVCPQCDMVSMVPKLGHREYARCPRCHKKLFEYKRHNAQYVLSYTISALIFFIIANAFTFISFDIRSIVSETSLMGVQNSFMTGRMMPVLLLFITFIIVIPIYCMLSIILLHMPIKLSKSLRIFLISWLERLTVWSMAEVFLTGVLISFVRLRVYGDITLGLSFASYCLFTFLFLKVFLRIDYRSLWKTVAPEPRFGTAVRAGSAAISQGIMRCPVCGAMRSVDEATCCRCGKRGSIRQGRSLQTTAALLVCAALLYLPANIYPVMTTSVLADTTNANIIKGVIAMWNSGAYFVGIIIFIASIVIPVVKIIGLTILCVFAKRDGRPGASPCFAAATAYKVIDFVGRWSMIDVFVVAISAALVRAEGIMMVYSRGGIIFFAMVVIITIFAAHTFDPRLIWDRRLLKK